MIPVASRDSLLLFCEEVDKLLNSSTRRVLEQGKQPFRFSARVGEPVLIETNGPPDDSIEAFVLTLRFFIQDNESISIRNIATLIDSLPVSDVIKDRFATGGTSSTAILTRSAASRSMPSTLRIARYTMPSSTVTWRTPMSTSERSMRHGHRTQW